MRESRGPAIGPEVRSLTEARRPEDEETKGANKNHNGANKPWAVRVLQDLVWLI